MFESDRPQVRSSERAPQLRVVATELGHRIGRAGGREQRSGILFGLAIIAVYPHFGDSCWTADDAPASQGTNGRFDLLAPAQPLY